MGPWTKLGFNVGRLSDTGGQLNLVALLKIALEVLVIVYAVVWLWGRIRRTQAERLVKGVLVLSIVCYLSWLAGFTLFTLILQQLIPVAVIAILIIFQPEIRRGLGYLGRGKAIPFDLSLSDNQYYWSRHVIEQVIAAVSELSRTKCGALIVIEPPEAERDYLSPGTMVNGDVSSNLLLSIFYPNSPLHDGAVVVRKDKILAAGVILPITDNPKLGYRYGTRHRAAIGLSEIYDALCIVVSEETGAISAASRGMLVKYDNADELADPLAYVYHANAGPRVLHPLQSLMTLFGRSRISPGTEALRLAEGPDATEPASTPAGDLDQDADVDRVPG